MCTVSGFGRTVTDSSLVSSYLLKQKRMQLCHFILVSSYLDVLKHSFGKISCCVDCFMLAAFVFSMPSGVALMPPACHHRLMGGPRK